MGGRSRLAKYVEGIEFEPLIAQVHAVNGIIEFVEPAIVKTQWPK